MALAENGLVKWINTEPFWRTPESGRTVWIAWSFSAAAGGVEKPDAVRAKRVEGSRKGEVAESGKVSVQANEEQAQEEATHRSDGLIRSGSVLRLGLGTRTETER
jgi:hypothetical protein